jgi:hypothetical protein
MEIRACNQRSAIYFLGRYGTFALAPSLPLEEKACLFAKVKE